MRSILMLIAGISLLNIFPVALATWTADNGNGTFTNPLFYDEFSDPDMIRVGDDYYLTGTTMHCMPGLPILHSKDLVNWEFLCYAFDRLDLGPEFRLEEGREIYGQGIWAPCFRYHDGIYYIFTNINRKTTQLFRATNPAGPWTRTAMKRSFHDLSVLFDDDGKVYVIWGYQGINFVRLNDELTDSVPGSERIIIPEGAGMGEGVHFYKLNNKYYITSAWFAGRMRMPCARADKPEGPYEVNLAISTDEDFGLAEGWRLRGRAEPPFNRVGPNTNDGGRMSLHQGGLVDTKTGQWWGFSMMDYNSVGRLTCLSPITWQDGWPYFGLPGNLKRTPRTWVKPDTGYTSKPCVPYERNDDFSGIKLKPIWQWNHVPDDTKWSLTQRPGFLRLHSLPSRDLWLARNTLTQRSIGPISTPTAVLDASGMQIGDVAGLALLNAPYAWIGVSRKADGLSLDQFDQFTGKTASITLEAKRIWLRAHCDFLTEKARFSYSINGEKFESFGAEFTMVFQLKTFQGIRYSLFHYNTGGAPGGYADFDKLTVDEPYPHGFMRPIPFGQTITLSTFGGDSVLVAKDGVLSAVSAQDPLAKSSAAQFKVIDRGLGRVALQSDSGFISVSSLGSKGQVTIKTEDPTEPETFQWTENVYGDLMLLSLFTHRHIRIDAASNTVTADHPGPRPDRKDGSCLIWKAAVLSTAVSTSESGKTVTATVLVGSPGKPISPDLFGIFFEDLNYAADGGLYAEMVQNRSFEYSSLDYPGWHALAGWELVNRGDAKGSYFIGDANPLHPNNPQYLEMNCDAGTKGTGVGILNSGFDGMVFKAGEKYDFSVFARQQPGSNVSFEIRLESKDGTLRGQAPIGQLTREWKKHNITIQADQDDNDGRLVLLANGKGTVYLDMISLFPRKTFHNRSNGLRADLAQAIADMKPKFMRFPGGCLVHGDGLKNLYRWKDTIGPVGQRKAQKNIWRYHQTAGLGYFEYFQFCEDIGAKPLPVVAAGVSCQNSDRLWGVGQQDIPLNEMQTYVQDVLDLVEYANGPATSTWGARRAEAGHPEPFNLQYLGVGNEDAQTPAFRERFKMIYDAVKAKYPQITVIGTVGPSPRGSDFDEGWKFANTLGLEIVDEHYYEKPDWFLANLRRYNTYDRSKSKVYVGEYASKGNSLANALAEAAYMTSFERNGDIVHMASYAPLLAKLGHTQWNPDLIYFTNSRVFPTINYYVQQMFSTNSGDTYLPTAVSNSEQASDLAVSCVRDSKTNDLILKLVNVGSAPKPLRINLSGTENLATSAVKTMLSGDPRAVNDAENPRPLIPETSTITVGPAFDCEAPPYSLTVIRIRRQIP